MTLKIETRPKDRKSIGTFVHNTTFQINWLISIVYCSHTRCESNITTYIIIHQLHIYCSSKIFVCRFCLGNLPEIDLDLLLFFLTDLKQPMSKIFPWQETQCIHLGYPCWIRLNAIYYFCFIRSLNHQNIYSCLTCRIRSEKCVHC